MYWLVYLKNGKMEVITIYENLFILHLFMYFSHLLALQQNVQSVLIR